MHRCILVALALVAFAGFAFGENSTTIIIEKKHVRVNECCAVPNGLAPATMKTAFKKCFKEYPKARPPKPPVGGFSGAPPPPPPPVTLEVKNARACVAECVFSEEGLLTPDKEVNKTAVISYFASSPTDEDLNRVRSAAVEKCLGSYKSQLDTSLDCKSGADELHKCVNREIFLNCPKKMWSPVPGCEDLKEKVKTDKNVPIFFREPKRRTKEAPKLN